MSWNIALQIIIILVLAACTRTPITAPASAYTPTQTLVSTFISAPTEILTPAPLGPPSEITQQGVKMALIPAGEFHMGSENGEVDEKPAHTVYLDDFFMDVYEVTNGLYEQCVQSGFCSPPGSSSSYTQENYYGKLQYEAFPVIYVDWEQANRFCAWRGARLPTMAEWEKAARGGLEGMEYPWGNEDPVCKSGAENGVNFVECGNDPIAVGSFAPNGYELYDMAGNVWEWIAGWYGESYYSNSPANNPTGPSTGQYRVVRGGSWADIPSNLRVAELHKISPDSQGTIFGFRCACSASTIINTLLETYTPTP